VGGVIKSTVFLEDYHKPLSFLSIGIDKTRHPGRDCRDPDAMDGNLNQVTSLLCGNYIALTTVIN
jgi:hypothetical protein